MRTTAAAITLMLVAAALSCHGQSTVAKEPPAMKCEVGPLFKSFGGSRWFLNSCADGQTLVIYSSPGSPAEPFYFMFYISDSAYKLYGEGTGAKAATEAAMIELKALSREQIRALIEETKAVKK